MLQAKVDLGIELERADRRYHPGDRVSGCVNVYVDTETKCDALTLKRQWRTHGRGNRASGPEERLQLFAGTWQPGTYAYAFDLPCPDGPMTHRGRNLNVDWYIDVAADVPWAIDPKASTEFFVEPQPDAQIDVDVKAAPQLQGAGQVIMLIFLAPFLLVALASIAAGLFGGEPAMMIFGLFGGLIAGVVCWAMFKQQFARRAFSRLSTRLERDERDNVRVLVDYASRKPVNQVVAKLLVEEIVTRGSGTDSKTYRETLFDTVLFTRSGARKQDSLDIEFALPDPRQFGWSFEAPDNKLWWSVVIAFDIEGWPDLDERMLLQVSPRTDERAGPYR